MPSQHTKLSRSLSLLSTTQAAHILILFVAHTCMHNSSRRKTLWLDHHRLPKKSSLIVSLKFPNSSVWCNILLLLYTHTQFNTSPPPKHIVHSVARANFSFSSFHITQCSHAQTWQRTRCDVMRCDAVAPLTLLLLLISTFSSLLHFRLKDDALKGRKRRKKERKGPLSAVIYTLSIYSRQRLVMLLQY